MADSADDNNNVIPSGEGKAKGESQIKLNILAKKNTELFEQKREVELSIGVLREEFQHEISSKEAIIAQLEVDLASSEFELKESESKAHKVMTDSSDWFANLEQGLPRVWYHPHSVVPRVVPLEL